MMLCRCGHPEKPHHLTPGAECSQSGAPGGCGCVTYRPDPLDTVREATRKRLQSEQDWRRALRDARATGLTVRQISGAAGVSFQRVHQLTAKG